VSVPKIALVHDYLIQDGGAEKAHASEPVARWFEGLQGLFPLRRFEQDNREQVQPSCE